MKYNKWTVALAALGVVSFASAAKAEEKASSVMTALSSTTISGYVDTSAAWNPGTGNANMPPYKFGGAGKADGFNLDVIQLRIEKPLDEQDWAAGYRADFWFGPDAKTLGTDSYLGIANLASDFAIRQAYVSLRAPVGRGLDFKVGVFDSILGYESVEAGNNPNFTRSYGHSIEPQTHTGILTSYRFCDCFSASFGVADTMGPSINTRANPAPISVMGVNLPLGGNQAESYKTYMGSIALTAPDSWGFLSGSTLYAGVANGFAGSGVNALGLQGGNVTSYYVGATVATPVTGLRVGAAWDYFDNHNSADLAAPAGDVYAMSIAGYLSYQATEKLSFHARAEYFKDKNGVLFQDLPVVPTAPGTTVSEAEVLALTATIQYDLWKNVISRLEVRWDHSLQDTKLFGGTPSTGFGLATPAVDNAVMIAANIIYKF
jgi:Putative beta-barrel porin-2, OmpL-like. bbp2